MKQILSVMIIALVFCQCSTNTGNGDDKAIRKYKPGDRAGADTSMMDISDSKIIPKLLCQHWDNQEDYEDTKDAGTTLEIPFRGFYLFSDGSMVKNPKYNMLFGTWAYDVDKRRLQLKLQNGTTETYYINDIGYKKLSMSAVGAESNIVRYEADGFVHKELINDPFYAPNLQWRVRPQTAEDDAALHKRLKGFLHFYYLYYKDNSKRNAPILSFYGLPGCFTWYAGGIHLKKEGKLDKSWTDLFYNAADASKAYIIADKLISKKYIWDKNEASWVNQNAGVLLQMEAKIDSL